MKILVCIKQVPASSQVKVDPESGVLKRTSKDTKLNPYDEYAIESAVKIREKIGGTIAAITMGAPFSEEVLRESFGFGVDEGYLVTDAAFAGADVLATSFAISQAIDQLAPDGLGYDLIICGRQTTDGDTAQVGPALAEQLKIPHVSWVSKIVKISDNNITVEQDMGDLTADATMSFPCLITVEKDIFRPRLPSYVLMKNSKERPIKRITLEDLKCKEVNRYGLKGSPTQVERMFSPQTDAPSEVLTGTSKEVASLVFDKLKLLKLR